MFSILSARDTVAPVRQTAVIRRMTSLFAIAFSATLSLLATAEVRAQTQVVLNPSAVIGGSSSYNGSQFNVGGFAAGFIFDNQGATAIDEGDQSAGDANGGYWLGSEGDFTEYVVIDLGAQYNLSRLDIFNTHNAFFNDRGTRDFQVFGANAVTAGAANTGLDLSGASLLLSSALVYQTNDGTANPELTAQGYAFGADANFRYLRINTLTQFPTPAGGFSGVGLNEVKVFQTGVVAVPEISALALLGAALPVAGLILRKRNTRSVC